MAIDSIEVLEVFDNFEGKLEKSFMNIKNEFMQMKAGRANPHILDKVYVNYYGTETPINQMANISVPEARMLIISAWDTSALKDIEKAIIAANIGVNPNNDGKVIRMIFPELNEERRKELVKQVKQLSESAKVAMRNARRDANDSIKKYKKDSVVTEDECATLEKDVDKKLAEYIESVDKISKEKEKEVMSV